MAQVYLTVNGGSGSGWKTPYSSVSISATVPTGYHFVNWTSVNTAIDNVNARSTIAHIGAGPTAQAVQAHIGINYYSFNYYAGSGGSIGGDAGQSVAYGQDGTVVFANASAGYHFVTWSDGDTNYAKQPENVSGNGSYTATFAADEAGPTYYALTVTSGTGDGSYVTGTSVAIVADAPSAGFHFLNWTGDTTGIANVNAASTTITTQGSAAGITANYEADGAGTRTLDYTVSAVYINGQAMGTITGDVSQVVNTGDDGTEVVAVANAGFVFSSWNDNILTAARTDLNVTVNKNVTAIFAVIASGYTCWM